MRYKTIEKYTDWIDIEEVDNKAHSERLEDEGYIYDTELEGYGLLNPDWEELIKDGWVTMKDNINLKGWGA